MVASRESWYLILGGSWSRFPHANDCGQWQLSCHAILNEERMTSTLSRQLEQHPLAHGMIQSANREIF
jgi:hypothetical protein